MKTLTSFSTETVQRTVLNANILVVTCDDRARSSAAICRSLGFKFTPRPPDPWGDPSMAVGHCAWLSLSRNVHTGWITDQQSSPAGQKSFLLVEKSTRQICSSATLWGSPQNVFVWVWLWICGCFLRHMNADIVWWQWAGRGESVPKATEEEEEEEEEERGEERGAGRRFEMGSW